MAASLSLTVRWRICSSSRRIEPSRAARSAEPRRRGRGISTLISCAMRPCSMTSTRSASATASDTSCVTRIAVKAWSRQTRSSSRCIEIRVSASSAPSGSSNARMRGLLTSARASATRCFCPPESTAGHCSRLSPRPTSVSAFSARACASGRGAVAAKADLDIRQAPAPMATAAAPGTSRERLRGRVSSPKLMVPASMRLETCDQAQQRALAAAAAADDRDELAGGNVQIDAAQHSIVAERFVQAADGEREPTR